MIPGNICIIIIKGTSNGAQHIEDSTSSYGCLLESSGSINSVMNLTKLFLFPVLKRQRRNSVGGV